MKAGLRIDVDTLRGTREGVPTLCRILAERELRASFFFSVGPDNMGRHLWRLLRPTFLWKMLRSSAPSLYGWEIVLRGTLWPGPVIGQRAPEPLRTALEFDHEMGFHSWDHHGWQAHVDEMSEENIRDTTQRGVESIERIVGVDPVCSAAAGWRCHDGVLRAQAEFPFIYQSDCRGDSIFLPLVDGEASNRPQIPVTLPTYDEVIGRDGTTDANYNERLLARLDRAKLNVLTIHAEVEGGACAAQFVDFLDRAADAGWDFVPLAELLPGEAELPVAPMVPGTVPGRAGLVACQGRATGSAFWSASGHEPALSHPTTS